MMTFASSPVSRRGGVSLAGVTATVIVMLMAVTTVTHAAYTHNDPSGYNHPGCIDSNPDYVGQVPSANRTCPGKSMEEVWDFDTEIQPYNKKVVNDAFDAFFTDENLLVGNDYNTPTYSDFTEPKSPPQQDKGWSKHGQKRWHYQFPWQSSTQTSSTGYFNIDIALEYCNMTVIKRHLINYIAESDSTGITVFTDLLETALRDDFHNYRRKMNKFWMCGVNYPTDCQTLGDEEASLKALNDALQFAQTARNISLEQTHFDAYKAATGRSTRDYSFLTGDADDVNKSIADLTAFNAEAETQVKAQYVTAQDVRLQTFLTNGGYSHTHTVTAHDEDIAALNAAIAGQAETDWIDASDAALQSFLADNGYTFVTGASITTTSPDVAALNTDVEGQVEQNYVDTQNSRMTSWQSSNGYGYLTGVGAMARGDIADANYLATLNAGWETAVEARWKSDRDAELSTFVANNGLGSLSPAPNIDDAISDISAFNADLKTRKAAEFLASSGLAAAGVSASDFNNGNGAPGSGGFNYTAYSSVYTGSAYVDPPDFTVNPAAYSYTAFAFDAAYAGYTDFTLTAYVAYVDFALDPAWSFTPYVHTRSHTFVPYKLREPSSGRRYPVPSIEIPEHIDKKDMTNLFVYHKAWYYQTESTCKPTCAGSMNAKTDYDTDPLAAPRVCDVDDTICPTDNASPTWEEFSLIVAAKQTDSGAHDNCPVSEPCKVSPPPCFYVATDCIPQVVLDETLDNTDTRVYEDETFNEDEKYLHEPIMDVGALTTWKLVSNRVARDAPFEWNYRDGLVMDPYTSPVDNRDYHKVCTFALVSKNYKYFERGVEYGFSIAEPDAKDEFGHTEHGQDSYGQDNHVYDAGHTFHQREKWQRTFGETVAPRLDNTCSGIREEFWRNRLYKPAQQFESQSYVFGTCAKHCGEVAAMGKKKVHAATLGGSRVQKKQKPILGGGEAAAEDLVSMETSLGRQNYRGAAGETGKVEALRRATGFEPNMPVFLAGAAACIAAAVMIVGSVIEKMWLAAPAAKAHAAAERTSLLTADAAV